MTTVIVSAYYKIPSKQPHSFYVPHLQRWFRANHAPTVFFTTPDVHTEILSWGYPLDHIQFVMLPFEELRSWSTFDPEFWNRQKSRDPESYHTPELGAVWFEKKEFVLRTAALRPDTSVFVWCDAGCVRNDISEIAMAAFGSRNLSVLSDGRLHVQKIRNTSSQRFYRAPYISIAGAIMAGTREAWQRHSELYNRVMLDYDSAGVSANMDQYIIASCIDCEPDFYTVHHPEHPSRIDPWFFFLGEI